MISQLNRLSTRKGSSSIYQSFHRQHVSHLLLVYLFFLWLFFSDSKSNNLRINTHEEELSHRLLMAQVKCFTVCSVYLMCMQLFAVPASVYGFVFFFSSSSFYFVFSFFPVFRMIPGWWSAGELNVEWCWCWIITTCTCLIYSNIETVKKKTIFKKENACSDLLAGWMAGGSSVSTLSQ